MRVKIILGAAALVAAAQAGAQQAANSEAPVELDKITVTDSADYFRFRSDSVSPRLIYESEYFSRFEPLSVGDMLKQLPGVAFVNDIGEYEAPQLRGIGSEYTQVLINGQRVAGAGEDRGVFVDRIPAELVERIEIIRSPQADVDAQGVGGSINIVLKQGGSYSGGQYRIGGYRAGEGTLRGSGYLGYGGQNGRWSWLGSLNLQERYNPKDKTSSAYVAPEEEEEARAKNLVDELGFVPDSGTIESDVRDSLDTGVNGALSYLFESGASLGFTGWYLGTDRDEDELTRLFDGEGEADGVEYQHENIDERTLGLGARYRLPLSGDGEFVVGLDYDKLSQKIDNLAGEVDEDEIPLESEDIDTDDDELRLNTHYLWNPAPAHRLKIGVQIGRKQRDASQRVFELDDESGEFEEETEANGVYEIEEQRYDAYVQDGWTVSDTFGLDFGLRIEHSKLDQQGFDSEGAATGASEDQTEFNPNLHALWKLDAQDQLRASVARTVRRPNFVDLVPFSIEDDDEFFVGNPQLEAETAIGYDLGFERRFARQQGIVGINLFYRDVSDVIEVVQIAENTESPANNGDGTVWGVELDSSLPLAMLGLPSVSVYGNYTYLKSEIADPNTGVDRRFNKQPIYVANIGFSHKLPWRITYGASFQRQGKAQEYAADEIVDVEYDGNLEAFVEYRINDSLAIKLNGSNLLDSSKDEFFRKYDDPRPDGQIEEIEFESERIGRIAILTLRGTF